MIYDSRSFFYHAQIGGVSQVDEEVEGQKKGASMRP